MNRTLLFWLMYLLVLKDKILLFRYDTYILLTCFLLKKVRECIVSSAWLYLLINSPIILFPNLTKLSLS